MLIIYFYNIVVAFIVYCCLLASWLQTSIRYERNWILSCILYVMPCLCGIYHTGLVHTATYTFTTLLVKQKYYIQIRVSVFVCRSFRSVHSDVQTGNRH